VIYQSRYSLCHPYHHSILLVNNILRLFLHAVVPTNTTYCWELTSTPRDTLSGECVCVWGSYAFTAMNRIDVCAFRAIAHCMLECTPINVRTSSPNILQVLLPSGEHGIWRDLHLPYYQPYEDRQPLQLWWVAQSITSLCFTDSNWWL